MVSGVGISAYGTQGPSGTASGNSVGTLELRIRQDQIQLNDWTTCVSASTPKGQAAIQKLSGEISGAKEQISKALTEQSNAASQAAAGTHGIRGSVRPGSVDTWA